MISFLQRHGTGLTFAATVLILISAIAGQVPTGDQSSLLVWGVYAVVSPLHQAVSYVIAGARDLWSGYADLRGVQVENRLLRREISRLYQENDRLSEKVKLSESLFALEEYKKSFEEASNYHTITVMVIGAGVDNATETLLLNRGSLDGVETEQGVICPAGVVGKVIKVGPTSCLVQLATDTRFAMAARLQRNRLRGIVRGTGDIECELLYIRDNDSIRVDDLVVSSGLERIFPIGVPVGVVVRVGKGEPPFRRVLVLPSTDFRSLEWVMIVTGRQAEAVDLGGEGR